MLNEEEYIKFIDYSQNFYKDNNLNNYFENLSIIVHSYLDRNFIGLQYSFLALKKDNAIETFYGEHIDLPSLLTNELNYSNNYKNKQIFQIIEWFKFVFRGLVKQEKITGITNSIIKSNTNSICVYDGNKIKLEAKYTCNNSILFLDISCLKKDDVLQKSLMLYLKNNNNKLLYEFLLNYSPESVEESSIGFSSKHIEQPNKLFSSLNIFKIVIDKIYDDTSDNHVSYFIIPKSTNKHSNGLIGIGINNFILTDDFIKVELLVRLIFSEVNMLAIDLLTKNAEWKTILDEMSHHNHHIYGAIKYYDDKSNDFILKNKYLAEEVKKEYKRLHIPVEKNFELLARSNDFLLALNKKRLDSKIELSSTLENTLKKTKFSFLQLIQEIFTIIEATHEDLGFNREFVRKKSFEKFQTVKQECIEYYKKNDLEIENNYEGAFICLLELVKNAIRHSESIKPEFSISHILKKDELLIKISNNGLMREEDFNWIKTLGKDCTNSSITKASFGLRTVFRIIDISEYGYRIKLEQNEIEKLTYLYFIIPLT